VARLVVDGMNVIGSRPDGWWRDRDGAARALLGRLQRLAAGTADEIVLVLDGRPPPGMAEGDHDGVTVLYPRSRSGDADGRIVELVASDPDPDSLHVVTSDRLLRRRVGERGGHTTGVGAFQRRLDEVAGRRPGPPAPEP
jgi:predicted RNA-binding protein with PIN domain